MDKLIEKIAELLPFGALFQKMGYNKNIGDVVSLIIVVMFTLLITRVYNFVVRRYKLYKATKNLLPQFDKSALKKYTDIYIQTQFQNASPTKQEEPGFTHQYVARNKLIPFFIKTALEQVSDTERFYIILADSGMGKTTFMVNLFLEYNSFFNFSKNYKMKILRFSNHDTISLLKQIDLVEAKETILLLDAFDEDPYIISQSPDVSDENAFIQRLDEVIEVTKNFRATLITCRTQYFPLQESDPYELKVRRLDEKGFYILNKIYISPFNDKEVRQYLNKKFGLLPSFFLPKKKKAFNIIEKCSKLTMRPMMLSYIDLILNEDKQLITSYDIYKSLIDQWLKREGEKKKRVYVRGKFIDNLEILSEAIALEIYKAWIEEKRMYLTKTEVNNIAIEYHIDLLSYEITGQSLLTNDGLGNWKFSHKSILEFLLAKKCLLDRLFFIKFNFSSLDMAQNFFSEQNAHRLSYDADRNIWIYSIFEQGILQPLTGDYISLNSKCSFLELNSVTSTKTDSNYIRVFPPRNLYSMNVPKIINTFHSSTNGGYITIFKQIESAQDQCNFLNKHFYLLGDKVINRFNIYNISLNCSHCMERERKNIGEIIEMGYCIILIK